MKKTSPAYVIGFMIVICTLCGTAISIVQFSMQKTLDANARLVRNRTIARAFDVTVARQTAEAYDAALDSALTRSSLPGKGRVWETFTRKDTSGDIGVIFTGMAFWDNVSGIIVLSADFSTIRSLEIIEQKETPGLGARIEEETFKQQFRDFPVDWSAKQRITFGKESGPDGTKRIDAITGATQTSMALERIINSELAAFKAANDAGTAATTQSSGGR